MSCLEFLQRQYYARIVRLLTNIVKIMTFAVIFNILVVSIFYRILNNRMFHDKHSVGMTKTELLRRIHDNKYNESTKNRFRLSLDERNVIFIIVDDKMNTTIEGFIHHFLLFHPQVIYLGSFTRLMDSWISGDIDYYIDVFINKLHTCHYKVLSEFVHYANDMLMKEDQPVWCCTRNTRPRTSLTDLLNITGYVPVRKPVGHCVPPSSRLFKKLCTSHHLALYISTNEYVNILKLNAKLSNIKTVTFLREFASKETYCYPTVNNTTSSGLPCNFDARISLSYEMFLINTPQVISTKTLQYCLLELCNYLDIYLGSSYFSDMKRLYSL